MSAFRTVCTTLARRVAFTALPTTSSRMTPLTMMTHRTFSAQASSPLADLLTSEIAAEKEIYSEKHGEGVDVEPKVSGFQMSYDQAEVKLVKQHNNETVTVSFNVTHTVNPSEEQASEDPNEGDEGLSPAIPAFTVTVDKNGQKLAFECEINIGDVEAETPFDIMEVYMHSTEKAADEVYAVSGGVIDGTVYDHLMTYLGERGVNEEMVHELMRAATQHEHKQYMKLLGDMKKFVE